MRGKKSLRLDKHISHFVKEFRKTLSIHYFVNYFPKDFPDGHPIQVCQSQSLYTSYVRALEFLGAYSVKLMRFISQRRNLDEPPALFIIYHLVIARTLRNSWHIFTSISEESANIFYMQRVWHNFYGLAADRQEYCFTKDFYFYFF